MRVFTLLLLFPLTIFAGDKKLGQHANIVTNGFIENKGQVVNQEFKPNPAVKYLLCHRGFNVQLRQTGFSYDTYTEKKDTSVLPAKDNILLHKARLMEGPLRRYHRVDVELLDCNNHADIVTSGESATYFNYFTTGTPQGGISNIHCYESVMYKNIYPHIDLEFQSANGKNKQVEYDFILHPGANVNDIKLAYKGMSSVNLQDGHINVKVSSGTFSESIPSSYFRQSGSQVKVSYKALGNNTFSFSLPQNIVVTSDLIIDPTTLCLDWSTYYGGSGDDFAYAIALDSIDNIYVAGGTVSPNNIATTGSFDTVFSKAWVDGYIGKFDSTGSKLLWGTYYGGGPGNVDISGLVLDAGDNIYVTGCSQFSPSTVTPGAYKTNYTGGTGYNAMVAKFNSTGTALLWGTYYGGNGPEISYGIAIDSGHNVYITGYTYSTKGIATAGAYDTVCGGVADVFVAKFNPTGSKLLWGTYYGGTGYDAAYSIALDSNNNAYITGQTASKTGISTAGSYQPVFGGNIDAFVAKFNSTGSKLLSGTYYGGTATDEGSSLILDKNNNIYINGISSSTAGIATAGAYQITCGGGYDAFTAKFNNTGTNLLWGTYFGGTGNDEGGGIALDGYSNVWETGLTSSTSNIATPGTYQAAYGGGSFDAYVARFNPNVSSLMAATYYGDTGTDEGLIMAIDSKINVFIAGTTSSVSHFATPGAYQTTYGGGGYDAYIARFGCNCDFTSLLIGANKYTICVGDTLTLSATPIGSTSIKYLWSPGGQISSSIHISPAITSTYSVTALDTIGHCVESGSVIITVNPIPKAVITGNNIICQGNYTTLTASGGTTYLWNTGASTNTITATPNLTTTYSVVVTQNGCSDSINDKVIVNPTPTLTACCDTTILFGSGAQLTSSGGGTYLWAPSNGLNCNTCSNTVASPNSNTTYTLTVTSDSGCSTSTTITIDVVCGTVFIPEAFSPNGDGQNDVLYVRGDCIKTMQFDVFDRWGNRVFETTDKNIGWNGMYKGEAMNTGSYVYSVTATMYDGTTFTKKGNVALVR